MKMKKRIIKVKINRKELLSVLEAVSPGLTSKEFIEQSNAVVFHAGQVITFNDEVSCSMKSPLDIEGAIVAAKLIALLKTLSGDEVEIELGEGELIFKGEKRKKSGIPMQSKIGLPVNDIEKPGEWKPLPVGFFEGVGIVQQCCASNDSKFALTCIHITEDRVEATDSFQVCKYPLPTGISDVLVRRSAFKSILNADVVNFSETEKWLHFQTAKGLQFSCRKHQAKFPDISKFFDVEGNKVKLPKEICEGVIGAQIFSEDADIEVELRKEKIRIAGRGVNGWFTQVLDTEYNGEEIKFTISPKMLLDIQKRTEDCEISKNRLRVACDKFTFVTCLGKVKD